MEGNDSINNSAVGHDVQTLGDANGHHQDPNDIPWVILLKEHFVGEAWMTGLAVANCFEDIARQEKEASPQALVEQDVGPQVRRPCTFE